MAENITLARPYAQAVFSQAQQSQTLAQWSDVLGVLSLFMQDPDMLSLVNRPDVADKVVLEMMQSVVTQHTARELTAQENNFLLLLQENKRFILLPEILVLYEELKSRSEQNIEVLVDSPQELDETQKQAIIQAMSKRLSCQISLSCRIDESLLAGIVIRAGDLVIDGSAISQIRKMSYAMLH